MRVLVVGEGPSETAGLDGDVRLGAEQEARIIRERMGFPAHLWRTADRLDVLPSLEERRWLTQEQRSMAEQRLRSQHMHLFAGVVCFGEFAGEAAARFFSTTLEAISWTPAQIGDHVVLGLPRPSHPRFQRRDDPWCAKARSALSSFEVMIDPLAEVA